MSNFSKKSYSVAISAAVAASALISGAANAQASQDSEVIRSVGTTNSLSRSAVAQNVTSVSQLSDVRPTDWAFTALQSLVERYGCIAGYPDSTFRGNQATSRYEFAAGLNACLDKINEIISAGLADKVSQEDLATLQKLQEEFAAELATLRGRVDALDAKVAKLEAQQFSTTTKLRGEAIFGLAAGSDGIVTPPAGATVDRTNLVFNYRARLNLDTSFTGKDLLRTRLQASNSNSFTNLAGSNSTRLSYDGVSAANTNLFELNRLYYRFPVGDAFTAYVAPIGAVEDIINPLNPLESDSQGTISRFGRFSPLIRIASSGNPAVAGFDWKLSDKVNFQAAYSASNAGLATGAGGVTNGDTKIAAQFVFKPADALTLGVGYANAYTTSTATSILGSGLNLDNNSVGIPAGIGLKTDTVVGSLIWDITKKFTFNTWGSWTFANGANVNTSSTLTSWAAALSGKDLFSDGDLAAVIFGQPLTPTNLTLGGVGQDLNALNIGNTPYHLEALYRFRVSKNITITPGVFFVFNQNSASANGTATVGVIRTTFSF
ncbi:iron uptake porin [Pseudanabaena mucicola]|uniref:Carbohydrate porin n=1 Tax=Pseudanabaena mucicola FACHB-723 TaxID=2692860 RepID=A0ABR7ZW94_9CYAN|nr:iron uptake porin [Pseudanabaena mucicola]MBD2187794.1 carbohydrate porin [Pseudanabaena mucicola FACHB-723]